MSAVALAANPAPAPETAATDKAVPRRAVLALARVESVRLLRHPVTIVAVLVLFGFWVETMFTNQANQYPVLQDVDLDSELGVLLLLGGAALIAGNLAVLRAHRDGTTPLSQVLVLPDGARTVAHLLALLPLAVLAGVLVLLRAGVLFAFTPAAGHPVPYEVATGPATVLLLGAIGVLLGRLTRSPVAAPLALFVLLASLILVPNFTNALTSGGGPQWLQPVIRQTDPALPLPVPVNLLARPAGAHLLYLLGLAGLFAVLAVARAGGRGGGRGARAPRGARGARIALAAVVALACAVTGAVIQAAPAGAAVRAARIAAMDHPSRYETCRTLDGVDYCAFAGFGRWAPAWNTIVQAVLARVPAADRPGRLTVRQRLVVLGAGGALNDGVTATWRADDAAAGTPDAVTADTRWGDSRSAATLAALVAYRLVSGGDTGPASGATAPQQAKPGATGRDAGTAPAPVRGSGTGPGSVSAAPGILACGGAGVLVVWLAGQASPQADTGLHNLLADQGGDDLLMFSQAGAAPGVAVPKAELTVALAALDRPASQIAALVQQNWAVLTARGTSVARAAQILGVPAPAQSPSAHSGAAGDCR